MSANILFLVPARGGSRRVPGKNMRLVGGIPLVGWAVRIANDAARSLRGQVTSARVLCSTDDDAIGRAAAAWGADVLRRPADLATDTATSVDVALHALEASEAAGHPADVLVLVQPTSPLVDPADVAAAVRLHLDAGASVTGVRSDHPAAWHLDVMDDRIEGTVADHVRDPRGTDMVLAGAFYVISPAVLRRDRRFVTPGETRAIVVPSDRGVDIDDPHQLVHAEALLGAREVRHVRVGRVTLGTGPVVIIAEAGVNHDGDIDTARRLIDAAADSGANFVKFQTFDPAALAAADAPTAPYQRNAIGALDQRAMLESLALPDTAWPELQAHAAARGIGFLSTPFDDRSADLLDALGVPAFKVGSGELTNLQFIARLAARGRPLLLSTGMADMVEVAAAVDTVRANGDVPIALFHCVSSYPAQPADANLRAIETLRRAFGVPVGWSDHTPGIVMPIAAVAAGAVMVEKHVTLDRRQPGPDHRASLEPAELAALVAAVRATEASMGSGVKAPVQAELEVAAVARRSLHWARSLQVGDTIRATDLVALRPGTGMRPSELGRLVGRPTTRAVRTGAAVRPADVE
jgi:N,N'-diacetyllegionaminate synthase